TFFREAVQAKYAVLSLCASNGHGHPRAEVIDAARSGSTTILSTQVTPTLNTPPYDNRDGVIQPSWFSISGRIRALSKGRLNPGRRIHFACAGSITLNLGPGEEPRWGNLGDPEPICSFKTIDELRSAIARNSRCKKCSVDCFGP